MELAESINAVLRAEEHETYDKGELLKKPNANIQTLLNIYNREKGKEHIVINIIFNYPYPKYSYLGFEFLVRIKEFKKAFVYLEKNLNKIRNQNSPYFKDYYTLFNNSFSRLIYTIDEEKFKVMEIESLRNQMSEARRLLPKKHQQLSSEYFSDPEISLNNALRAEIIKKIDLKKAELIENNYNNDLLKEDLKFIIEKIREMELGEGIAMAFIKLEEKYYEARDNNDFAMYGGYIRETIMSLVKSMAIRIAKDKKEIVKERDEHYRNYLKTAGMINEGLWRMLSALYDFLSCGINHNIEIDQEYYRRGLNITSQVAYLLLRDYERFVEGK